MNFFLNVNSRLIVIGVYYINIVGSDVCFDFDYCYLLYYYSNSSLVEVFIYSVFLEK